MRWRLEPLCLRLLGQTKLFSHHTSAGGLLQFCAKHDSTHAPPGLGNAGDSSRHGPSASETHQPRQALLPLAVGGRASLDARRCMNWLDWRSAPPLP